MNDDLPEKKNGDANTEESMMPPVVVLLAGASVTLASFTLILAGFLSVFDMELGINSQLYLFTFGILIPMVYGGFILIFYAVETKIIKFLLVPIWTFISLGFLSTMGAALLGFIEIE